MDYTAAKIEVPASGIRPTHDSEFHIDWPTGSREYGVVLFHNAVMLLDCDGARVRPPGTWIVYRPKEPRYYRALKGRLEHSWILSTGPGMERCLVEYEVPSHTAFEFGALDFLESYIHEIRREQTDLLPYHEEAITDLSWEFFRRAAALVAEERVPQTPRQRRKAALLREIKIEVHTHLARHWTVRDMAELAGMNPTRFAMDYHEYFGISPIYDLIDARLNRAENMLRNHAMTVKQVALECGFTNHEHFNRLFHNRRGSSPGRYRRL